MDKIHISDKDIETLARCFLPYMIDFFESDEGRAEYEAWKKSQESEAKENEQSDDNS